MSLPNETTQLLPRFGTALADHAAEFNLELSSAAAASLQSYYALLLKWNARLHLVGPCSPEEFATRHVLESLFLLPHLPPDARVVDIGSGAGLPMIPCLIVRSDLRATLIESSRRKTVFLSEALRVAETQDRAQVIAARFESTPAPEAGFVTSRALDRFEKMLPALIEWAPPESTLLIYGGEGLRRKVESYLPSARAQLIPRSDCRFLIRAKVKDVSGAQVGNVQI